MVNKIVIDTCVFVEAIFGDEGNPSAVLMENLETLGVRLAFSQDTIGELLYILKRECNGCGMDATEIVETLTDVVILFQKGRSVNTLRLKRDKKRKKIADPNDQMFVDTAFESEATHLITLDKKSGILKLDSVPFECCTPSGYFALKEKEDSEKSEE
ncbi:putative toxin-antitoxin system toxin component, PIN family [Priestia koreensis]|uniref:PIN domain-containing protein n=1 Tax=Priestia koreensis TaxID=284581 RepID=A0A0M0LJJ0_9BACI|nr:putative toxin-antitoxin system toxin component, PIN family [Priestia koreensis]KOO50873.1 hypothetical protein AMD01_03840 [Priestia koreensis]